MPSDGAVWNSVNRLEKISEEWRREFDALKRNLQVRALEIERAQASGELPVDASRLYKAGLAALEEHMAKPGATVEGFGPVFKRAALDEGLAEAATQPLPRLTRGEREALADVTFGEEQRRRSAGGR